jgi:hypothetical protein
MRRLLPHKPGIAVLACALLSLLSLSGCASPRLPSKQAIVGTWQGERGSMFVFNADMTFAAVRIPQGGFDINSTSLSATSDGVGKWMIRRAADGYREVSLVFSSGIAIDFQILISGSGDALKLYLTVGDPDNGVRLFYRRR